MKMSLSLLLAAALVATPAYAKPATQPRELGVETSIAFPGNATIRNWQADDDDGVWIQDGRKNWYYGKFFGPCHNIDFAQAIGVDTAGLSRLDRFSTILVRGDRCQLTSFVTSAPPPSKKELKAARDAEKAARAAADAAASN